MLYSYLEPRNVREKTEAVQTFISGIQVLSIISGGIVAFIGAIVGIANWRTSQGNLQQQRELAEQRAYEDALQAYFEQMGGLLTDQDLVNTAREDVRQLAQAQSHTVLARLDGSRKGALLRFLQVAGLIRTNDPR
jgi:hypothetical protein